MANFENSSWQMAIISKWLYLYISAANQSIWMKFGHTAQFY